MSERMITYVAGAHSDDIEVNALYGLMAAASRGEVRTYVATDGKASPDNWTARCLCRLR